MFNEVTYKGIIEFDLENVTNKHIKQSEWKRTAMVILEGEIYQYYQWFLKKRYNLILNKPLRESHISFINDRFTDVKGETLEDKEKLWNEVKNKYNGKSMDIILDLNVRTNAEHWWLNVTEQSRTNLQVIRNELGLNKPYFGLHMTIGYSNDKNLYHSEYIHNLLKKGLIP